MDLSEWSSRLTALAHRVINSLGPTKADLEITNDFTYRAPAVEQNLIRDICGYALQVIGLPSGYPADSIQGRLDALEAGGGALDLMDPKVHFRAEDFDTWTALSSPGWDNSGGVDPWAVGTGLRGGMIAAHSSQCFMAQDAYRHHDKQEPTVRFYVESTLVPVNARFLCAWYDIDDNLVCGVQIKNYGPEGMAPDIMTRVQAVYRDTGGVQQRVDLAAYSDGTVLKVSIRIEYTIDGSSFFVSLGDGAETECGPVAVVETGMRLAAYGPYEALASGTTWFGQLRLKGTWDPDLDP